MSIKNTYENGDIEIISGIAFIWFSFDEDWFVVLTVEDWRFVTLWPKDPSLWRGKVVDFSR